MSRSVFEVFLSSTSKDLAPHRAKVRDMVERLGEASICMETFGAQPTPPLETCRQAVQRADALVVIVGHRYGWIPGADQGDRETSITWHEVRWALDAGKPVFAFLVDVNAPWTESKEQDRLVEAKTPEAGDEVRRAVQGLQDFRAFLESHTTRELFTSADDLGGKVATTLANWLRGERAKAGKEASAPPLPAWTGSPFPGLRAFTPADAPIFFGRDRETDFLVAKLADSTCRFLLVVGTSGSGKSSLVAAGLIPRLASSAIAGSEHWLLTKVPEGATSRTWDGLRFTPGEQGPDPFQALANKLAPMLPENPAPRDVAQALRDDPDQLPALIERTLEGRPTRAEALMFVDQFEEIVTVVTDDDLRTRFVRALAAVASSARVRVVGTVRADFYHHCLEAQPRLADLLRDHGATVPLTVPGAAALAQMIDGPARRAGLRFDDGLVDAMVDDTVSRPGGLALLAFALHELYEARTGDGGLTEDAYRMFGGLAGVIKTRADETYDALPKPVQERLGAVFSQLVLVDDAGLATRSRARQDDVAGSPESARFVDAFDRARLLVPDRAADGTIMIEVAHEALLREWPLLARWIAERADDLRLVRQVEAAAREWDRHERTPQYGWPQERLAPVYESLERLGIRDDLREPARSFVRPEWEWLVLELEKSATTHERRAAIGDRLDQLGDPRPGVGVKPDGTPDIGWCEIPGGSVEIQAHGRFDVAPFWIAKYPITYRQYRAFLEDPNGHGKKAHWQGFERAVEAGQQYRRTGNHPAENVSWNDATAFCRWLSERLGFEVRLPHEAEWQQAATGGQHQYTYPWGPAWESGRANTNESRLGRTIAVGMYPRGASAQGGLDLSGNIWEWCLSAQDDPRGQGKGKKDKVGPVLRGGSWSYARDLARAASRLRDRPGGRSPSFGFRVVCVSPIP